MRFSRLGWTFVFGLVPAAVSAQSATWLKTEAPNQPYGNVATTRAHDDVHSRLERAHQQWHFAHDRGQRDRTYQRAHEQMHQTMAQRHDQWHAQYDSRSNNSRYGNQPYGNQRTAKQEREYLKHQSKLQREQTRLERERAKQLRKQGVRGAHDDNDDDEQGVRGKNDDDDDDQGLRGVRHDKDDDEHGRGKHHGHGKGHNEDHG